jgi:hypothetical protein
MALRTAAYIGISFFALCAVAIALLFSGYNLPLPSIDDVKLVDVYVRDSRHPDGSIIPRLGIAISSRRDLQKRAMEWRQGTGIKFSLCKNGKMDESRNILGSGLYDRIDAIDYFRDKRGTDSVFGTSRADDDTPGGPILYHTEIGVNPPATPKNTLGNDFEYLGYDLGTAPQDVCLQLHGGNFWVHYRSNTVVISKERIAEAIGKTVSVDHSLGAPASH